MPQQDSNVMDEDSKNKVRDELSNVGGQYDVNDEHNDVGETEVNVGHAKCEQVEKVDIETKRKKIKEKQETQKQGKSDEACDKELDIDDTYEKAKHYNDIENQHSNKTDVNCKY